MPPAGESPTPAPVGTGDDDRLVVTYELDCGPSDDPFALLREIAFEQTVELPEQCVPAALQRAIVGRLAGVERLGKRRWQGSLSYPAEVVGPGDVPQLLNVLYGNVSLKPGVKVTGVAWPRSLVAALPGPAFGIAGIRRLIPQAEGRALLCTALKPIGLIPSELADLAYRFARGGVDLIKDDHGLADQSMAPFAKRVTLCQAAVQRARRETGSDSMYLPHLAGRIELIGAKLALLEELGIKGALVSPFILGLDVLRWLAETSGLVLLAHPTWSGTLFTPKQGFAREVICGDLLRLLGADGSIYVGVGGRFPVTLEQCEAINERLRRPWEHLRPAFPVAGGGTKVENLPRLAARYGPDTVFLVGGSLYAAGEPEEASRQLIQVLGWQGAGPVRVRPV